ncbi:MAG TPA: hypothetical protein VHC46_07220 [Thermodesulfobacteriota bacterium]|nr:hypothetical protein [Thermodesulfobacteriota bacterium]
MAKKESPENVFAEFMKILETQKTEIEKITKPILEGQKKAQEMAKPVLEYQQKLFLESLELQKALMENIMETTKKMLRIMSDNPMKYGSGSSMSGLGMIDDKFSEYMKNMQKVQDNWLEQVRNTASMFQDFMKKSTE